MPALLIIFAFLVFERCLELYLSSRNMALVRKRGGIELYRGTFPAIALLHTLFLLSLLWESYPWRLAGDLRTWLCGIVLLLLQGGRYWCMVSLGENWNTRIVLVPGATARRRGPYRFLRHPNYLIVLLEFIFLPLLMRAPVTLALFLPANVFILRARIRLEEEALKRFTDYGQVFELRPRPGTTPLQ